MRIKAYIDTNIYIYAIIHHPLYGGLCAEILRDIEGKVYEAYGSTLVAVELLGALSRINPRIARRAVEDYLSLDIGMLDINEDVIRLSAIINEVTNTRYDSVHAALVLLNHVPVVITNDLDDWYKINKRIREIVEEARKEGYDAIIDELQIVSPRTYHEWRESIRK